MKYSDSQSRIMKLGHKSSDKPKINNDRYCTREPSDDDIIQKLASEDTDYENDQIDDFKEKKMFVTEDQTHRKLKIMGKKLAINDHRLYFY